MRPSIFALLLALAPSPGMVQTAPIRLVPQQRIGCADCAGPALFATIAAIALADGKVFVADTHAPFIRVFDVRGRLLRAFAAHGDGPGELKLPILVAPRAHGAVEVYDMRQRRMTRFDSTGVATDTRTLTLFATAAASAPENAAIYLATTDFRSAGQPILRLDDGSREPIPVDTLGGDFPRLEPGEMARTPVLAAHPRGGYAAGDGVREYRIHRFAPTGRMIGDLARDIPRVRKSSAEIEAELERRERRRVRIQAMARAEGARATPGAFTPAAERNHFGANALAYDARGRLWVRTDRGGLSHTIFDVFTESHAYLGEVRVAARLREFALDDNMLAAVMIDENEIPYVGLWAVQ